LRHLCFTQESCRRLVTSDNQWKINVKLKYSVDGGSGDNVRAIANIECTESSSARIEKGDGIVEFSETVEVATIKGETALQSLPAIGTRSAVELIVDGSAMEDLNA